MPKPLTNLLAACLFLATQLSACAADQAPDLKPMAYIAESTDIASQAYKRPTDEVSILGEHYVVVIIPKPTIGVTYNLLGTVVDDAGKKIELSPLSLVAEATPQFMWMRVSPDYKTNKSGKWTAVVTGRQVGKLVVDYTVLPPTPGQQEDLARYEQARESVFRAFAEFWVGVTNQYGARSNEVFYYTAASSRLQNYKSAELLGIGSLIYNATTKGITEADRLNGITYHGSASFGCSVYRQYRGESGWTLWKDTGTGSAFFDKLFAAVIPQNQYSIPEDLKFGYGFAFDFEQKDGHWRVTGENGTAFLNGKLLGESKQNIHRPSMSQLRDLIDTGRDPRRVALKEGDDVKASPEQIEEQIRTTMRMLRGGAL